MLAEILASGSEVGAAFAVYVDKRAVVDLWAGHTDAARTRPWDRDTIVNLYSVGKAVTSARRQGSSRSVGCAGASWPTVHGLGQRMIRRGPDLDKARRASDLGSRQRLGCV
jgi:hypothetical protein